MKDLLNMVLDLRKMEVGKSSLKIESVRINDWLTAAVEDMKNEGKEVGINIRMETDSRLEMVELDRQKCDTVVTNILMNAIKHSTAGDTITIRTELTDEGMARVRISDQGPGLVDIDESRMFTMFYQSDQEQYGSGIGLSYSKILVELHGGHIHAENNHDRGASFWWEIPVISPEEKDGKIPSKAYLNEILGLDTATEEPETDPVSVSTSEMSLMLVDDNQDLLYFLKEALCSDFADIILMTSGNKAYSAICAGTVPDMIISDIHMPDGDGFKLCKDIKSNDKFSHIPVVLLTARSEGQSQGSSYRLGADGFIEKPFEIDTLMDLIRSIFRRKAEIRKKYLDSGNAAGKYGSNDEGFIIRFNKVVEENLGNPDFDQQILCRELGMSRAALYNRIKTVTGTGSKEYITRIRIERAKALIEKGGLSLTEISEMTGFSAPGYFSTAFKNYTGMTPSQYRQGLRKQ
jgi:DNA-binding response OmpR family regulator/two-component sensor histidine kinase